jgi:hypothetical protein
VLSETISIIAANNYRARVSIERALLSGSSWWFRDVSFFIDAYLLRHVLTVVILND